MEDAHVKDMVWAVCGSSSWIPRQEVTSISQTQVCHFEIICSQFPSVNIKSHMYTGYIYVNVCGRHIFVNCVVLT